MTDGTYPYLRRLQRIAPLLVAAGCLLAALPARANPIAGAMYSGVHAGGGTIRFTVAADGTAVTSYRADGIPGDTCVFVAEGDEGEWPGAPIVDGAFTYRLYDAIVFSGTFAAAQSAAGTLRLFNRAVPGVTPACDSGTIAWTATTSATPLPPGSVLPPPPAGQQPARKLRTYRTTVLLRTRDKRTLTGRTISYGAGCTRARTVRLKRGLRTLASAKTNANGSFAFKRTKATRGAKVRVTVTGRRRSTLICAAGASRTVRLPTR